MGNWEPSKGASDEWMTPKYVFDALGLHFDLDVAAPEAGPPHVPCRDHIWRGADKPWGGVVWMNPPFGGRNGLVPWLNRFFEHGNGVALTPDRSSTEWWQDAARQSDAILAVEGKIKFERLNGAVGKSPSNGTTLFARGAASREALFRAERHGLGTVFLRGGHG